MWGGWRWGKGDGRVINGREMSNSFYVDRVSIFLVKFYAYCFEYTRRTFPKNTYRSRNSFYFSPNGSMRKLFRGNCPDQAFCWWVQVPPKNNIQSSPLQSQVITFRSRQAISIVRLLSLFPIYSQLQASILKSNDRSLHSET